METFIVYVNDREHAARQIVPLLDGRQGDRWVLVACPPRLNRHSGRWLTQSALRRWRADWARATLQPIEAEIVSRGNSVLSRCASGDLTVFTRKLKGELGVARVLDARRPRAGATLEPVTQDQPRAQQDPWAAATGGAVAISALLAIAAD